MRRRPPLPLSGRWGAIEGSEAYLLKTPIMKILNTFPVVVAPALALEHVAKALEALGAPPPLGQLRVLRGAAPRARELGLPEMLVPRTACAAPQLRGPRLQHHAWLHGAAWPQRAPASSAAVGLP